MMTLTILLEGNANVVDFEFIVGMKQERAYQPPMEQIQVMTHLPQERMHSLQ